MFGYRNGGFLQKSKEASFSHIMKAQKSYYASATAIIIENLNNGLRNRKLNVASSTPVQPPGTLFHPTFMILLIRLHFENDSRMYFLIVLFTYSAGAPGRVV